MKRPLIALISVLVIVASGISIYLSQRAPAPRINLKPFEGLGIVGAEQVAKLLGGKGRIVLVAHDTKQMAVVEAPVKTFLAELPKHGAITVVTVERLPMDRPDAPVPDMGLAGEKFVELLRKHSGVDAIVNFVGGPYFRNRDYQQVPTPRPKVVSMAGYSPQTRDLIELGVIQLAVVPRFVPPPAEQREPQTPREWFDRFYTVVTPETVGELPGL